MIITELTATERLAWWQLNRTSGVGPITFFKLIERYGTATRALEVLPELARRGGRQAPLVAFNRHQAEQELNTAHQIGARAIAACEPDYPRLLRETDDAPPVIFVRGQSDVWARPCIGLVGARNASLPGRKIAQMLARDLGTNGYTIVSGLARGIDTAAHEGSFATGTVAVVAGGVDIIYPPENDKLYARIANQGAILSEHPPGLEPKAPHFPRRNRIISGISQGVCVIEATTNSGSLITARMAAEQGRDVFAVPGSPLDPRAAGPNHLIREGAILVERADHIIHHLTLFKSHSVLAESAPSLFTAPIPEPDETTLTAARTLILENLSYVSISVDELIRSCQLNRQIVQIVMLELELAERVQRLPGNRIVLIDKGFLSEPERSRHC